MSPRIPSIAVADERWHIERRDRIAAAALQGLISGDGNECDHDVRRVCANVRLAVQYADALIEELAR